MRKNIMALFMCAVMVISILPVSSFAEDDFSAWTYKVLNESDKTAEITGYNGTETELVFPEEIDGYTMVAIANNAFKYKYNSNCPITSITIPDTYKKIGSNVFSDARNLKDINLPDTLEFIGLNAFLKTSLYLDTMDELLYNKKPLVFYIGEYLICADQNGDMPYCYTVKPGTKLIASGAFFHCSELKKVIIPEGVEYVNDGAFIWCDQITSVVFPNSVKKIAYGSFAASSLSAVVIPEGVEYIDENAFTDISSMTVYGVAGTLAEDFAIDNGLTFVELKDVVYGDVDGDGVVSSNDYASMKSNILCEIEYEGENEIIGDMNGDCVIDGFDSIQVDMIVNGLA